MITKANIMKTPSFTGVTNLYHLFYLYNVREVLVDKSCKIYVDSVYDSISQIQVDFNITEPIKNDHLSVKMLKKYSVKELLTNSPLKQKYDLFIVHRNNFKDFLPFMHRAQFIYVHGADNDFPDFFPYTKVNDCFDGVILINDFHSMMFPFLKLSMFQQTYVRDKSYRYLRKMQELLTQTEGKVIVEIGSCRSPLKHELTEINPRCCDDSHSTFFWAETGLRVFSVDVNPLCKGILQTAEKDGYAKINGKVTVKVQDGLDFLRDYKGKKIDLLHLDSWEVCEGGDYAEKHLEAFELAEDNMSENSFISIEDCDIGIVGGGKGKLLIPHLLEKEWVILYKGRQTILYNGSLDLLFA